MYAYTRVRTIARVQLRTRITTRVDTRILGTSLVVACCERSISFAFNYERWWRWPQCTAASG